MNSRRGFFGGVFSAIAAAATYPFLSRQVSEAEKAWPKQDHMDRLLGSDFNCFNEGPQDLPMYDVLAKRCGQVELSKSGRKTYWVNWKYLDGIEPGDIYLTYHRPGSNSGHLPPPSTAQELRSPPFGLRS